MRSATLFLAAGSLLFSVAAHAQTSSTDTERLPTYQFDISVPVTQCRFDGKDFDKVPDPQYPPAGSRFTLIGDAGSRNVIQFLQWDPDASDEAKAYREQFNVTTEKAAGDGNKTVEVPKYFCVDRSAFQNTASRVYATNWRSLDLAVGVLVLPFKMRFRGPDRDFDFSKDVTLGTVVGPRVRLAPQQDVHASFLFGAGLTAVTLDSANTRGVIKQSTDRPALTFSLGPMLEVKRFQVGLMVGWDMISRNRTANWRFNERPWLAMGLGYTILGSAPSTPAGGQTKP